VGEEGQPVERGHVEEAQIGRVHADGLTAVELDLGQGGVELVDVRDVGLAVEDDPGGIVVVGGLDTQTCPAEMGGSHECPDPRSCDYT
jgi:hypothetical protein